MKNLKRYIDALTYIGGNEEKIFKVKPHDMFDSERNVVFTKGETKYSELDLRPDTISYLKRDYKESFTFYQEEFSQEKLFALHFEKLIRSYSEIDISKITNNIFLKIDKEKNNTKERGRPRKTTGIK